MSIMTQKRRFWVVNTCDKGSKMGIFSNFGGLTGDFYKDIYEANLCGINIGSVSSCSDAENGNTDGRSWPRG